MFSLDRRLFIAAAVAASLGACAKGPADRSKAARRAQRDVTVFAAASLRESFTALGRKLEATHPHAHVVFSFAGSQALRSQIEQGAPADVFASADQRQMQALVTAKRAVEPRLFATNELVVIVSKAKESTLREFRSLPDAERIVLGGAEVPVGTYTNQALYAAARDYGADFPKRVETHVVSREPDVRQVLSKVALGEADAGVVYRTDALTWKDKVAVVSIPTAYNVRAQYPVAVTATARAPELAREFVDLLLSPEGQKVLAEEGFLPPGAGAPAL